MNIVESLWKSATQQPSPLHAGEVMSLWSLYVGTVESRILCLMMANHTSDVDLKETIEHYVADVEEPIIARLKEVLAHEGIPVPPASGEKPRADETEIPPGAKMTDYEIANLLVVKLEGLLNLCHFGMSQALRDDVGTMLWGFYQHALAQGFTLKKMMRERGWLRIPPIYPFGQHAK